MGQSKQVCIFYDNVAKGGATTYLIDLIRAIELTGSSVLIMGRKQSISPDEMAAAGLNIKIHDCFFVTPERLRLRTKLGLLIGYGLWPFLDFCNLVAGLASFIQLKPTRFIFYNGGHPGSFASLGFLWASRFFITRPIYAFVSTPAYSRKPPILVIQLIRSWLLYLVRPILLTNCRGSLLAMGYPFRSLDCYVAYNYAKILAIRPPITELKVLGFAGRIVASKGVFELIAGFHQILKTHPDLRLVLAGEGPDLSKAQKYISSLGCDQNVSFVGHSNQLSHLMSLWDLFIFPSHHEGFPQVIIEAAALGVPIVSTTVGGMGEFLDQNNHIPLKTNSAASVHAAIERAFLDIKHLNFIRTNAHQKVQRFFTKQRYDDQVRVTLEAAEDNS